MNALEARYDAQRHWRAIQTLCERTGATLEEVRDLFDSEILRLGVGAKVGAYLAVLTEANVRAMLRRKAVLAANVTRAP